MIMIVDDALFYYYFKLSAKKKIVDNKSLLVRVLDKAPPIDITNVGASITT